MPKIVPPSICARTASRIGDAAAVEGDVDLLDGELARLTHLHVRDGADDRSGVVHGRLRPVRNGDARPSPFGSGSSPTGLLRGDAQTVSPGLVPFGHELQSILERIDPGGRCAFVDERFDEECVGVVAGRAIGAVQHIDREIRARDVNVRNDAAGEVGHVVVAERQLEQRLCADERGLGSHRRRIAVIAQHGLEARDDRRAKTALSKAFLARPDRLDGDAGKFLGDRNDHADVIALRAAPESAADEGLMQLDLLGRQARLVDRDPVRLQHVLRRAPHLDRVFGHERRAVQRLHRRRFRSRASNKCPRRSCRP